MNSRKTILLILITFILKAGLAFYFAHLMTCQTPQNKLGYLASGTGDTPSYIEPIDNFIERGSYYSYNGKNNVYAGRTPHYGTPYFIFRLAFSKSTASDLYALLQILLDSTATVFFALLCFNVLSGRFAFWIGYTLFFLNFNMLAQSTILFPESISLSFFVFFLYSFHRYWANPNLLPLLIASIFLAIVVTLKAYLIILFVPFALAVFFREKNFSPAHLFRQIALLSLPLLLLLLPWIVRNAIVLHRFIPTQDGITAGYNYTESDFALRRFVGAWGGDFIFWNPNSSGCYFQFKPPSGCNFVFPEYALAEGYTMQDVQDVRQDYMRLQENYSPELDKTVSAKFDRLTNIYKSQKPFTYHIYSRVIMIKNFLWHTNNFNLPINPGFKCYRTYQLSFKIISFLIYIFTVIVGTIGLVKLSFERKISLLFISIPILILCFFAGLKVVEYRYFNHAFPVLALGFSSVLCMIANAFLSNRRFAPETDDRNSI